MKSKLKLLYYITPILAWLPQVFMTLNSFSQVRFEEFITSVQAPFWFYHHQIVSGLHVNVGWYGLLVIVYKIFGFTIFTGRFVNLFASFISLFVLAFLLKKFFDARIAAIILITLALSPTWLFINSLNMHMAMTYHLLIIIILILMKIDFSKIKLSLILTGILFLLVMLCVLTYQSAISFLPSIFIFYWLKYRSHLRGVKAHPGGVKLVIVAIIAFILPVIALFAWVDNKQLLIWDSYRNTGLFRGGGLLTISEGTFSQNWTYLLTDFFIKGISGHYEVASAEFSYIFPIISLLFIFFWIWKIYQRIKQSRKIILLIILVMVFNTLAFSFSTALTLPGMNRMTPFLLGIYFLWIIVWWGVEKSPPGSAFGDSRWRTGGMRVILGLLLLHHLIVYPINFTHLKDPSPFKVADWFDSENAQKSVDSYVLKLQSEDIVLNCKEQLGQSGQCFYDFIYSSIAGSCEWNHLDCHKISGYDPDERKIKDLNIDYFKKVIND